MFNHYVNSKDNPWQIQDLQDEGANPKCGKVGPPTYYFEYFSPKLHEK